MGFLSSCVKERGRGGGERGGESVCICTPFACIFVFFLFLDTSPFSDMYVGNIFLMFCGLPFHVLNDAF